MDDELPRHDMVAASGPDYADRTHSHPPPQSHTDAIRMLHHEVQDAHTRIGCLMWVVLLLIGAMATLFAIQTGVI